MQPRVIYRTHYQVDEPAYMELLIKYCTSAVQSSYSERVAQRLSDLVSSRKKKFNVSAAAYALDLARGLGVITDNNTWSEKGQLLALTATVGEDRDIEDEFPLNAKERLTHFRLFLEGDGAVLLYIAKRAVQDGRPIPAYRVGDSTGRDTHDWNRFAREMFKSIYSEYLATTGDLSDRIAIRREVERLATPYKGKTGVHKSLIHLQAMFRMGLLERSESQSQREYVVSVTAAEGLRALLDRLPTVAALEEMVAKGTWAEAASLAFRLCGDGGASTADLRRLLARFYRQVTATGVPFCSVNTLVDAVQVHLMSGGTNLPSKAQIMDDLTALQRERSKDVRFHVDRRGRVAFVKMSEQLVAQLE